MTPELFCENLEILGATFNNHILPFPVEGDKPGIPAGDSDRKGLVLLGICLCFPEGLGIYRIHLQEKSTQSQKSID